MLIPISKFYRLLKNPINIEDELLFIWDNEIIKEVKTEKNSFINNQNIFILGMTNSKNQTIKWELTKL